MAMNDEKDEITFSDEAEEENSGVLLKKLREKLKVAEEKAQEYLTGWQKERAELANARRRDNEAQAEFLKFANEKLIVDILPVLDSFNVALEHAEGEMKKGVEQIRNQLVGVLEKNGVKEIKALGEMFDPNTAHAITMVPVEETGDDHKVVEVLQTGYSLNGRVIRPAMVKVGEFKS